jgi:xanthine dehydrogenase accessory factor
MSRFEDIATLVDRGEPVAVLTVVGTDGSAPREVGTRMAVTPDDEYGTIGGGTVEGLAVDAAREVLAGDAEPGVRSYELRPGGNTGMVCQGEMDVFIDCIEGQPRLFIAGGGHIGGALADLATGLGYSVTVVDDRPEYADPGAFPETVSVVEGDYESVLRDRELGSDDSVAVATRSSTFDKGAIAAALDADAGYVGFVASQGKAKRVLEALAEEGYDRSALARVRAPVGLDLGRGDPPGIALSIMAELSRDRHGTSGDPLSGLDLSDLVVVRGGGDLGSGVVYRLHRAGFPVVVTEVPEPTVVRRGVAFGAAVYEDSTTVEGVTGRHVPGIDEAIDVLADGEVPVLVDPAAGVAEDLEAAVLVDATMLKGKRDSGTRRDDAPVVVGLGPGFEAGEDVDAVVETDRGHELGRAIYEGAASPYDGEPGERRGYTNERVVRAPTAGEWEPAVAIGDLVAAGDTVGTVAGTAVTTEMGGLVRGLVHGGLDVDEGTKLGDVDPRGEAVDHTRISDKALSLGGGVLEAVLRLR